MWKINGNLIFTEFCPFALFMKLKLEVCVCVCVIKIDQSNSYYLDKANKTSTD